MSPLRKPFSSWKWAKNSRSRKRGERTILKGGGLGDLQEREPQSGRVARRRSHLVPKDKTLRKDFPWWRRYWILQQFVIERGFRSGLSYNYFARNESVKVAPWSLSLVNPTWQVKFKIPFSFVINLLKPFDSATAAISSAGGYWAFEMLNTSKGITLRTFELYKL